MSILSYQQVASDGCDGAEPTCPNYWFDPGFTRALNDAYHPFLSWYFGASTASPGVSSGAAADEKPGGAPGSIIGFERIPPIRPAILIMNHSGMSFPWDALLAMHVLQAAGKGARHWMPRALAVRGLFALPGLNQLAVRMGIWPASMSSLEHLIRHGELLLHFPEGLDGLAKGWSRRYRLRKFRTGVFLLAARYRVPVLPVACVGAESFNPLAVNLATAGRVFGIPMFPLSPLQLLLYPHFASAFPFVLPSRVTFHVGDPLYIPEGAERDRRILEEIAWHARRTIQEMLDANR